MLGLPGGLRAGGLTQNGLVGGYTAEKRCSLLLLPLLGHLKWRKCVTNQIFETTDRARYELQVATDKSGSM